MALSLALCLLLTATLCIAVGASKQYKVGGDGGWRLPNKTDVDLYRKWASEIEFQVGDSILFEYKNDSVVKVDKRGYYHCNESSREPVFTDGKTVFLLNRPGFYYFVSAALEHCKEGQRLMIEARGPQPPPVMPGPSPSPVPSAALRGGAPSLSGAVVLCAIVYMAWCPSCMPLDFN